jgi:hemerythrin
LAFIEWSEGLEIGVDAMDSEHRALVDAINQLEASLHSGEERSRTIQMVARVARESKAHFASEEAAMANAGFPGAALHALKHQHMAAQILAFLTRYSRDTSALNEHMLKFLSDSLTHHIRNEDALFGRWAQERAKQ